MKAGDTPIRTVITGVGVVSPIGIGKDAFWQSLIEGRSGIGYLRGFRSEDLPTRLAAQIHDFAPEEYITNKKLIKVMSRDIQLGVAASTLAMGDAALVPGAVDPDRLGVSFGAGRISSTPQELSDAAAASSDEFGSFEYERFDERAMGEICPLWLLRQLPNMPACHVSIEFDARGPNNTITCRESSALLALAEAVGVIERGAADCMIVGASSSHVHPVDIAKLSLFDGLSRRVDAPDRACRPFDFDRDGTIVGEGGAAFVVERYSHAVRRGARIYAEVLGVAAGCDGTGSSNGNGGTGLVRAIRSTMRQASLRPADLGHINAHGKSTQRDDLVEACAFRRTFDGDVESIPVTALKSYFGHFDAGSGAVELAGSLLALERGTLPMTLNYETPDPRFRLRVVHREPLDLRKKTALTVNRTAMGQSAAAIIRAV
jgi:3-oxoacyl-[acyl-carrier-protein] synthase II